MNFCVEIETDFDDVNSGDRWTTNADRNARGVRLLVQRSTAPFDYFLDADVSDTTGCRSVTLSDANSYKVYALSKGTVNGVPIHVYDDSSTPAYKDMVFFPFGSPFTPVANNTVILEIPASTASAAYAVASYMFSLNNLGLGSSTPFEFFDDACCVSDPVTGDLQVAVMRKFILSHFIGHTVMLRREGNNEANVSYGHYPAGCAGDGAEAIASYYSAAAYDGFANVLAAWQWNDVAQSDCAYEEDFDSDFDLDGPVDNPVAGEFNCEGIPVTGLDPDITAKDWLLDVSNASLCSSATSYQSTPMDFLRFGWDIIQDEAVPIEDFVDIMDDANPQNWDATGSESGNAEDKVVDRISDEFVSRLITTAFTDQDDNWCVGH